MESRYIALITIEADTPLKVGSSASDFLHDSPVQRDWNGLPMILGTSIAGVLRKDFEGDDVDVFGEEDGSKVVFSNALLVDENDKVNEGLLLEKTGFLKLFDNLPIREHTAITVKGVAKEPSKFDEEVVYKGSRFRFSIEMEGNKEAFDQLLAQLESPSFRLGGGSTKGFGKFKVISVARNTLERVEDLAGYSSSLNSLKTESYTPGNIRSSTHAVYLLKIKPDDFFMFGSGFGDADADQTAVAEKVIDYKNICLSENHILIPASSVKGAISHRTTYHYNRLQGHTIENGNGIESVKDIFGEAKNSKKQIDGNKGKVLFSDCFKPDSNSRKVFDHVSIDRFTGGAIHGALFQEKTIADDREYEIEILLENGIEDSFAVEAFESALRDITTGMLPLGGAVTKGHGVFVGEIIKNGEVYRAEG